MIDLSALDHFLLFTAASLAYYLTLFRTLHALGICGAILLACSILLSDAHFVLAALVLAPSTNPQYITVAFCVIAALCVSLRTMFGKRSIDRIIMTFVMWSVVATAGLFHFVLIANVLPAWAKDGAWGNAFLLEMKQDRFPAECSKAGLSCVAGSTLKTDELRPDIKDRIALIVEHFNREAPEQASAHAFGHFNDLGTEGVAAVLVYSAPGDVRVIVDEKTGTRIHHTVRDGFYLLSGSAHLVWIIGGLVLIGFHRRRFARKTQFAH
jgi:hypothetical protein